MAASTTAREAADALNHALLRLAQAGALTPCQADPAPFFAEHRAHQAQATEACTHCPVLLACRRFADVNEERHGVWGGVLRSDRTTRQEVA